MDEFNEVMPRFLQVVDEHIIDPRRDHMQLYPIVDIVSIAILGTLCGADGYEELWDWGEANEEWLSDHLVLDNGIPPESCIRRVFGALDPDDLCDCFRDITRALASGRDRHISIDGKALRGNGRRGDRALMLLNAWGNETRLVLAQRVIEPGENEISALPDLIDELDLEGSTVTLDAVNTQVDVTQRLRSQGADYILAVKRNQPNLFNELKDFFDWQFDPKLALESRLELGFNEHVDGGHGRVETRTLHCYQGKMLKGLSRLADFRDANTIIQLKRERDLGHKSEVETRYFISSLPGRKDEHAQRLNRSIRLHWNVENKVHWVLDVSMGEDSCRVHNKRAAANLAVLRRMALNLLRHEPTAGKRVSIKRRRFRCCIDRRYLASVLAHALTMEGS